MASASLFSIEGKGQRFDSAADLEPFIKPLVETNDVITEIRLGGNTFGVPACERLASVLRTQKKLHTANLADIFTSRLLDEIPQALSFLLQALRDVETLETIDLSDNAFGLNTQAPLVEFLKAHTPLRHLILNNNGLGPKAGNLIADALRELHTKKEEARAANPKVPVPYLETIVCGRNRLESGSMAAWAKMVKDHGKGLRSIRMTQNGIRQDGIVLLLDGGLQHAPELEVLDLQDNTFTMTGSRVLARVVTGWPNIREISLSDCYLKGKGALRVAKSLAKGENKKIEILRLAYNDITAEGLKEFVEAAKTSLPALKRVELNGNKLNEEDSNLEDLRNLLEERKEKLGKEDEDESAWGLDELDELESEDEDEEEEEEEEEDEDEEEADQEEVEEKAERVVKDAERAENEKVAQEPDSKIDELASKLAATGL
ncbi:Ran specific GTPase activating protein An-RanGAP [Trichophyton interdigitale]|uniref:Ran specific GTPase activating protein An-RanGAP n=1 Tax=Trichophyton interdigitale TaxID=101480 RepID=A0A9P5CZZ1_9EURO|nr:Ran specific GTPase activating protein An-RanGAP [Trichophyton interdigitale]KAF3900985.1 Ran specific GTPase activating protein An-RanGAP [Trichophyton interdigitale]KAG8212540.1 Ran specific GTPase activating protein An-RanGAP [Trichophyton interdigitale]